MKPLVKMLRQEKVEQRDWKESRGGGRNERETMQETSKSGSENSNENSNECGLRYIETLIY